MQQPLWEVAEPSDARIRALADAAAVSRPLALILACRGIQPSDVAAFLQPSLRQLTDPFQLPGTEAAAERLWRAVSTGETILIHGDYDTDGITASVLLAWCLRANGGKAECFLPHRIDDGYGLTPESIEKACGEQHSILVTVDCGINSYEAIRQARRQGLDVIVTDHHEPGPTVPEANVVVNPKLPGSAAAFHDLAGVGVAFKVCHAFLKYGREHGLGGTNCDLRQVLDLVALGTVADIVPLHHENRCLVSHGLKVLSSQQRPGVRALCEICGLGAARGIRAADITFKLAPRLNAAGRLGDPMEAMKLLEARGMDDAAPFAHNLESKNRDRQQLEEETLQAAEQQLRRFDLEETRTLVVWHEAWPQGVIGIVASRLARRFHRPAVVLTLDTSGHWRGSARSVRRVNLLGILEKCSSRLLRFGGHPMAAGLAVARDQVEAFRAEFELAVQQVLDREGLRPILEICGRVPFAEITDPFLHELNLLEPIGHGNPEQLSLSRDVTPERVLPAGRNHARGVISDSSNARIDFICFGRTPEQLPRPPWEIAYTPQLNCFAGTSTPQAVIHDIRTV